MKNIILSALIIATTFAAETSQARVRTITTVLPCQTIGRTPHPVRGARFELIRITKWSENARYAPEYAIKAIPRRPNAIAVKLKLIFVSEVQGYREFIVADADNRFGLASARIQINFDSGYIVNKRGTMAFDCNTKYEI